MHKKNLIRDDDNESIYYSPRSEFDDKNDKYKKPQQNNNKDTKPPNVFEYLKRGKKVEGWNRRCRWWYRRW